MFSNLLFLILVLALIILSSREQSEDFFKPFVVSMAIYLSLLVVIYLQGLRARLNRQKTQWLWIVNAELIAFFFCYFYFIGGHRIFAALPAFTHLSEAGFTLILYFLGLGIFHTADASIELRFLVPFALPFLFLNATLDLFLLFTHDDPTLEYLWIGITIALITMVFVFFPFLMQRIWHCTPLASSPLRERLVKLCQRAHFRCAELATWPVCDHLLTAGIIGVAPKFRYILFSRRLLAEMPETSVEAILAHEIGHQFRRHLLIYPFIFFGMALLMEILSLFLAPYLEFISKMNNIWSYLVPVIAVVPYLVLITLFFRYVFGFFSRQFERQADLHVFEVNVPSHYLVDALNHLGVATGGTHAQPNWHHYSIQERIDFLRAAEQNRSLIMQHHRRVKWFLFAYALIVFILCLILFLRG